MALFLSIRKYCTITGNNKRSGFSWLNNMSYADWMQRIRKSGRSSLSTIPEDIFCRVGVGVNSNQGQAGNHYGWLYGFRRQDKLWQRLRYFSAPWLIFQLVSYIWRTSPKVRSWTGRLRQKTVRVWLVSFSANFAPISSVKALRRSIFKLI